ncbi:hypothetical protein Daura_15065 [Dactylosporangium aurantiacum]|uniref:Uncharacterized protein n=1 Tax=Dactylosporangium aurantiacum TaxID=35754 RepID=A0A9Q9IQ95_9ACTN|nr:hypothetical protein [Dactylosporangium aurantiacum]MDG6108449.1 hypothetical protein [Dactylosporangium aurantiacum]UWZ57360.1 hypothetical protein Daura_15065 [Dactylosporangium aurantiacum]
MRMVAQVIAAVGILVEGVVVGAALFVVGGVIGAYSMSLNGADPGHAQVAIRVAAVALGVLLVALAVRLFVAALRQRAARRWTVVALVVQCVVVTIAGVALGWEVFAGTLLVLGTLLYVVLDESDQPARALSGS